MAGRRRTLRAGLVLAILLIPLQADAQEIARGIYFRLGEKLVTSISPAGDVDTFVFYGVKGVEVSFLLKAKAGDLAPTMDVLDATGASLGAEVVVKKKGRKLRVRDLVLPETGPYFVRVASLQDGTGEYKLKTVGDLRAVPPHEPVVLSPGKTRTIRFGAGPGLEVDVKLKRKGHREPFEVLSVFDPDGGEIPHAAERFLPTSSGLRAELEMVSPVMSSWREGTDARRVGEYGLVLGGTTAEALVKVKIKVNHQRGSGTRVLSPDVPIVDRVAPEFGRPGTAVTVHGSHFDEGVLRVLFDGEDAGSVEFVSSTGISAVAPPGKGEVDVTVINPDGQEGVLEDGFIYVTLPPRMDFVSPAEGPDSGGTQVTVSGAQMTYVETAFLGEYEIVGAVTVLGDSQLRFTTEAIPAGVYSLTLTDRFGQSATLMSTFTMVRPPTLDSVTPDEGSFNGGEAVECLGRDFRPDHVVLLDGEPITTKFVSAEALGIVSPSGTIGDEVDVAVRDIWNRTSTIADAFRLREGWLRDGTAAGMPANSHETILLGGSTMVLGNVDGDGDLDIVIGRSGTRNGAIQTRVLLNADGKFSVGHDAMPAAPGNTDEWQADAVALGDLDGDGDLDLVLATEEGFGATAWNNWTWRTYWTIPKSTYPAWTYYRYSYQYWYGGTGHPYPSTRVLMNDGSGGFTHAKSALPHSKLTTGMDVYQGNAVALGDIDDDGDLDLVLSRGERAEESTYTDNPWTFLQSYTYAKFFWYKRLYSLMRYWGSAPMSDRSATRILLNDGNGMFTDDTGSRLPAVTDGDLFAADAVALVDIDDDGDLDLVITGDRDVLRDSKKPEYVSGSKTRILLNDGKGKFTNATSKRVPATKTGDDWGALALATGDLNSDGLSDLVLTTPSTLTGKDEQHLPSTRLFLNGTSSFSDATSKLPSVRFDGRGVLFRAVSICLGDVVGLSALDIVIVSEAVVLDKDPITGLFTRQVSSTRILRNDGSGGFTDDTSDAIPVLPADRLVGSAVVLGDVDDDKDVDLIVTTDLDAFWGVGKRPTRLLLYR